MKSCIYLTVYIYTNKMPMTEAQKRAVKKYRQSKKGKAIDLQISRNYYENNKEVVREKNKLANRFRKECERMRSIEC